MDEKERTRALDLALGQIEKQFGKGSILRLGSKDAVVPVSVISTGSISLDSALGVGGFPRLFGGVAHDDMQADAEPHRPAQLGRT